MNLAALLERRAVETPGKAALIVPRRGRDGHDVVSYAALLEDTRRLAGTLRRLGIGAGDAVVAMVPMSRALYTLALALLRIGAPLVFVDPWVGLARLDRCVALVEPKAFAGVGLARLLRLLSPACRRIPIALGGRALARGIAEGDARAGDRIEPLGPDAPALLTFTTGSTGEPKGVLRTHGFLDAQRRALTDALGMRGDDVDLAALPIFVLNNLANGATSVIPRFDPRRPAAVDPGPVVAQIEEFRASTAAASPAFFRPIVRFCRAAGRTLPSLRAVFTGGAPVPPDLLAEMRAAFPRAAVTVVYGSTEAEPIATIDAREILEETAAATREGRGSCVGRPVACARVRTLPPGAPVGEIAVAGPHVNERYYKNERAIEETKVRDEDGTLWHRTGDAGRIDEKGRIWLLGRTNAGVRAGDRTVWPLEVEPVVERCCPLVERAAFVGVRGRAVVAVVPRRGARRSDVEAAVRAACRERGLPCDEVRAVRAIPLDPRHNAKIDHAALARWLSRFSA